MDHELPVRSKTTDLESLDIDSRQQTPSFCFQKKGSYYIKTISHALLDIFLPMDYICALLLFVTCFASKQ